MRIICLLFCLLGAPGIASACKIHIEENTQWATASVRLTNSGEAGCAIDEAAYQQTVRAWLQQRPADAPALRSLSLGRAVDYPWISRHLADRGLTDPQWRKQALRDAAGKHNRFVADTLGDPAFLPRLAAPFSGSPFVVAGVSVEKVLLGPAGRYATAAGQSTRKVPFDAQVWLRLESSPAQAATEPAARVRQ